MGRIVGNFQWPGKCEHNEGVTWRDNKQNEGMEE